MKRLLVIGAGGQVGRELARARPPAGWEVTGLAHGELDIRDGAATMGALARLRPDAVANAAAYTAVDRAERDVAAAFAVNAEGARHVAAACAAVGAPLVHLSTDYVFDGAKPGAYREDDAVNPINAYGASKEAGERAVRSTWPRHAIVRTSWVFAGHGANFVRTMLRLGTERAELQIVGDQHGGPTHAADIARAVLAIAPALAADGAAAGTYHYAGVPTTTWLGFAAAIFAEAERYGRARPALREIVSAAYPSPAKRPPNSVLDCGRVRAAFGLDQPDWRARVPETVAALISESAHA